MNCENLPLILSGNGSPELARQVAGRLSVEALPAVSKRFADGEVRIDIPVNPQGLDVYIIQSTTPPNIDSHYLELLGIIDACRNFKAKSINAMIPHFGYSRQDKTDGRFTAAFAPLIARTIFAAGADTLTTIDLHNPDLATEVSGKWHLLSATKPLANRIRSLNLTETCLVGPDEKGVKRAERFARELNLSNIVKISKIRDPKCPNQSKILTVDGLIEGQTAWIVDDMSDTGGTLINAANELVKRGAKSVRAAITHTLLNDPALVALSHSPIDKLLVTDSLSLRSEVITHPKIEAVSVAPVLSEAISRGF